MHTQNAAAQTCHTSVSQLMTIYLRLCCFLGFHCLQYLVFEVLSNKMNNDDSIWDVLIVKFEANDDNDNDDDTNEYSGLDNVDDIEQQHFWFNKRPTWCSYVNDRHDKYPSERIHKMYSFISTNSIYKMGHTMHIDGQQQAICNTVMKHVLTIFSIASLLYTIYHLIDGVCHFRENTHQPFRTFSYDQIGSLIFLTNSKPLKFSWWLHWHISSSSGRN